MSLHDIPLGDAPFTLERNIIYQKELMHRGPFEKNYIELRKKEKRVYSDDVVRNLPDYDEHSQKKEWMIRKITMTNLISYFSKKDNKNLILELGCGNGWLSHQLAISLKADIVGLDINETELLQGARLFGGCRNLTFIHGDIFTFDIKKKIFDVILLAGSIQYFPDLDQLIYRLLDLLTPSGEIHIVDSPIYSSSIESQEAKKRSYSYFKAHDAPAMTDHYFHHHLLELKGFNYRILFKPNYFVSMVKKMVLGTPQLIFPWIQIKHH
jgi:SAM-dependent methyltransferase